MTPLVTGNKKKFNFFGLYIGNWQQLRGGCQPFRPASRPDVVAAWDASEEARRWMMLCPKRRDAQKMPQEPNEFELNTIRNDPVRLKEIRSRLNDIAWWMRFGLTGTCYRQGVVI
ncbi:MAG: hypothetical protein NTU79_02060 [Planctomycetota bacterium]|nr:hypothetical protein [Planctomycetota bacterium]